MGYGRYVCIDLFFLVNEIWFMVIVWVCDDMCGIGMRSDIDLVI